METKVEYVAYAQWPNKETWQNFGDRLPVKAKELSEQMYGACEDIQTAYEMNVVDDLFKPVAL